jgi:hypothetical protein
MGGRSTCQSGSRLALELSYRWPVPSAMRLPASHIRRKSLRSQWGVSLLGLGLMAPVATFVAPYGARLAHALSRRQLETAFGLYLLVVALRFLISLF